MKVDNFVIKLRAYPAREQKEKIDDILYGLRVAYNMTAYEISNGNEMVTKPDKKDESVRWPNFSACMKKEWLDFLRESNPAVLKVPATSLSSSVYGVFSDMKKSWETYHPEIIGKQKKKHGKPCFHRDGSPVWDTSDKAVKLPCGKWKPSYYSSKKPRTSFTVQTTSTSFSFPDNSKSVYIGVSGMGKVKCRGWRYDIRFGNEADYTFEEFYSQKDMKKAFGVTVSKDNCGDYWIVVKLQTVWIPDKPKRKAKVPIGVDVGIKDIAITSEGMKFENKKFKKAEARHKRRISRKLSRRWGWSNIRFREEHERNVKTKPSASYERTRLKLAKLDRKIARRRENYNHNVTLEIVSGASFIGIEDLNVKGMMANRHLSDALSDAAMYDVLSKLKYKAEWRGVQIQQIGRWDPSTKTCSVCGYKRQKMGLGVRDWICPECKTHHDRDVNAAINIRNFALQKASE